MQGEVGAGSHMASVSLAFKDTHIGTGISHCFHHTTKYWNTGQDDRASQLPSKGCDLGRGSLSLATSPLS